MSRGRSLKTSTTCMRRCAAEESASIEHLVGQRAPPDSAACFLAARPASAVIALLACAPRIVLSSLARRPQGIVHGDLKPLNIVRVGAAEWVLIDLDAASRVGSGEYMGLKTSTAVRAFGCGEAALLMVGFLLTETLFLMSPEESRPDTSKPPH